MRLDKHQPNPGRTCNDIFITILAFTLFFFQYYQFVFRYQLFVLNERVFFIISHVISKGIFRFLILTISFHYLYGMIMWSWYQCIFIRPGYSPKNIVTKGFHSLIVYRIFITQQLMRFGTEQRQTKNLLLSKEFSRAKGKKAGTKVKKKILRSIIMSKYPFV